MYFVIWLGSSQIELSVLCGNTLDFYYFLSIFHEVVRKRVNDPRERLARLFKYINQGTEELIKHYVQDPTTKGYQHPKEIQAHVNPHYFMIEHKKKIKTWLIINSCVETIKSRYCNFLLQCKSITQGVY